MAELLRAIDRIKENVKNSAFAPSDKKVLKYYKSVEEFLDTHNHRSLYKK